MPLVVDVGDAVAGEGFEVWRLEQSRVADLDSEIPVGGGEASEEGVQLGDEVPAVLEVAGVKPGELEDEEPGPVVVRAERVEEGGQEEAGVEEVRVVLAGEAAVAAELREVFDGDGVGDLVGEEEGGRDQIREAVEGLPIGEAVVGSIDANGREDLGVFGEAVAFEAGPCPASAAGVAFFGVELSGPPRILP